MAARSEQASHRGRKFAVSSHFSLLRAKNVHATRSTVISPAVPMNSGVLSKPVLDGDAHGFALPHTHLRPGEPAVVAPDIRIRMRLADDRPARLHRDQCQLCRRL